MHNSKEYIKLPDRSLVLLNFYSHISLHPNSFHRDSDINFTVHICIFMYLDLKILKSVVSVHKIVGLFYLKLAHLFLA